MRIGWTEKAKQPRFEASWWSPKIPKQLSMAANIQVHYCLSSPVGTLACLLDDQADEAKKCQNSCPWPTNIQAHYYLW